VHARPHARAFDAVDSRALTGRAGDGHPEDGKDVTTRQLAKFGCRGEHAAQEDFVVPRW